jgi:hypothetical protein
MESSLNYSFKDLYQDVLSYMGSSRDDEGDALTTAKRRVNDAYRQFLALDWSFLKKWKLIQVISGSWEYELPDDYVMLKSKFACSSQNIIYSPTEVSQEFLMKQRAMSDTNGTPLYFALSCDYSKDEGVRWKVSFYPEPNLDLTYVYCYRVVTEELSSDDDIPFCPPDLSNVLRAFCLAEVEAFDDEGEKTAWTTKLYQTLLPQAIRNDLKKRPSHISISSKDGITDLNLYSTRLFHNDELIPGWG